MREKVEVESDDDTEKVEVDDVPGLLKPLTSADITAAPKREPIVMKQQRYGRRRR
jgi:hypothetical protein